MAVMSSLVNFQTSSKGYMLSTRAFSGQIFEKFSLSKPHSASRFTVCITEKLSEAEKIDKTIELIRVTNETDKLDAEDLKSARELAMVQMRTQKASWLIRQMNGALRPFTGWMALAYLTEKMWSQLLIQYTNIEWIPIPRDPIIDFCMTGILAFFFGFRQRAKEKSVHNFQ